MGRFHAADCARFGTTSRASASNSGEIRRSPDGQLSIAASNSGISVKPPRTTVLWPTRIAGARFTVYSSEAVSERGSANVRKFGFHWAGGPRAGLHGTALVAIVVCRGGFETACGPVDWRSICPTNRLERSGVGVLSEGDDVPDESASFGSNATARGSTPPSSRRRRTL